MGRGLRRQRNQRIIEKRLRQVKLFMPEHDKLLAEHNRLNKQSPFDCGNPQCMVCHEDKVLGIPKAKYRDNEIE